MKLLAEKKNRKLVNPRKEKTSKGADAFLGAKFDFKSVKNNSIELTEKNDISSEGETKLTQDNKNIAYFSPSLYSDLKGIIDFTRKRLPAIVNLSSLGQSDFDKAIEFFSGAMYAMRGTFEKLDGKLYLVAPEGTATVSVQN